MIKKGLISISSIILLFILFGFILAETDEVKDNFRKGIEHTNQGNYDQAIQIFTQVITDDKDYANAYLALGIVYINKKMELEAVELLEQAIKLDPSNKKTYFILARLYEKLEDREKAIKTWEDFIGLNPDERDIERAEKHLKRLKEKE